MDLYTRGLLLGGMFAGMLLLAGIAVLIGRAMQQQRADQDRFDVGKGRKKRKKTRVRKTRTSRRGKKSKPAEENPEENPAGSPAENIEAAEPSPEPGAGLTGGADAGFIEELPPVPDSPAAGESPFGAPRARADEPW